MLSKICDADMVGEAKPFMMVEDNSVSAAPWTCTSLAVFSPPSGRRQQIPWIVPEAVERLDALLAADWQVFEFGSGVSTVWYATRVDHIISLEDDNESLAQVRRMLAARGLTNADIHLTLPRLFPDEIARFEDATFDLVVVDGNGERRDRSDEVSSCCAIKGTARRLPSP